MASFGPVLNVLSGQTSIDISHGSANGNIYQLLKHDTILLFQLRLMLIMLKKSAAFSHFIDLVLVI
jgi:hypothetical protein